MLDGCGTNFRKEKEAQAWLDQWDKKKSCHRPGKELSGVVDTSATFTVMDFFDKNIFSTETTLAVVNWFKSAWFQLLLLKSKKMSSIKMAGLAFRKALPLQLC